MIRTSRGPGFKKNEAGDHVGNKRDSKIDGDTFGDLDDRDINDCALKSEQRRQHGDEEPGVDRKDST